MSSIVHSPSASNADTAATAIPYAGVLGQREAASERARAYPYRFPRDRRQLGGKFSVEENSRRLLRFFYLERRLMQALGAWTLTIPEFEVKLETDATSFTTPTRPDCCASA